MHLRRAVLLVLLLVGVLALPATAQAVGPTVTITPLPADLTNDPTPTFNFTSDNPGATFECRVDTDAFAACDSPWPVPSPLADGQHTVEVRATVGGVTGDPASYTFTVDTTGPTVSIDTGPTDGSTTNDRTPTYTFSSPESGVTFECWMDSGSPVACDSGSFTPAPLSDGSHTFHLRAADALGNQTEVTRTFTVDTTGPSLSIDSGPAQGSTTNDRTPTFTFSSPDSGVTFECWMDSGSPVACDSGSFTPAPLSDGSHTFHVRATKLGNESEASRTFRVDATPPETSLTGPPASSSDDTPTFSFSSNEAGAQFECSADGAPFTACTSPTTLGPLAPGGHSFAVRARDAAGNLDGTPAALLYVIVAPASTPPPSAPSPPPPAGSGLVAAASALVNNLVSTTDALHTAELPAISRRRGITVKGLRIELPGSLRIVGRASLATASRRITALSGTKRFTAPTTAPVRLRASRSGRRLFSRASRVKLTVSQTFTTTSGIRFNASRAVIIYRHWLTLGEVARVAKHWIPRYFGDKPLDLRLVDCMRRGPTRIRCGHVFWRHNSRWWYVRLRVRELEHGFQQRMSNAVLW